MPGLEKRYRGSHRVWRRRGAQGAAIQQRLRSAAELGLSLVAAEVAPGSTSERNYLRGGFAIAYARTHYARSLG